jgi:hypothetical protein
LTQTSAFVNFTADARAGILISSSADYKKNSVAQASACDSELQTMTIPQGKVIDSGMCHFLNSVLQQIENQLVAKTVLLLGNWNEEKIVRAEHVMIDPV